MSAKRVAANHNANHNTNHNKRMLDLHITAMVMKKNWLTDKTGGLEAGSGSAIACLVGVWLAMVWPGAIWAVEPSPAAPQLAAEAVATGSHESAPETPPKRAPQVDLDEPVDQSLPLQVVAGDAVVADEAAAVVDTQALEPARAESVDLGEPVTESLPLQVVESTPTAQAADEVARPLDITASIEGKPTAPPAPKVVTPESLPPLVMLGAEVAPGTSTRLSWSPRQSFEGIEAPTPVLVVNGAKKGPVLCLTAAVHGDELNGIEIVRRVLYDLDAKKLTGTVVGVPIVNLQGFRRGSRYLADRRDLNRFFPGDPKGSSASRIAHSFFEQVISHCDALVDLHTGSFYRTNLPQLRADLREAEVLELSQGFDGIVVLQSEGSMGTLRKAAVAAGIPAVTLEAGEPMRLQEKEVNHGVKTVQSLLGKMGMIKKSSFWGKHEPVYYQSSWVRADQGGILFSKVELGEVVKEDEVLGTVTDPITNVRTDILSPYRGRVLGMALNQVVMPGFAAFRIGIQSSEDAVIDAADPESGLPSTLHTSQNGKDRPAAAEPVTDAEDFEGLEDSE